jgi:hypothetical protein
VTGSGRRLASAAILGAAIALIGDVLLQGALAVVRVDNVGYGWLEGVVFERSRWIVAAGLCWWIAPWWEGTIRDNLLGSRLAPPGRKVALRTVGMAMLALPIVWTVASLLVRALMITIGGDWSIDGRLFTSSYFYSNLVLSYAPWAMGGAVLSTLAYHAARGSEE